jgi:hypothetical protein
MTDTPPTGVDPQLGTDGGADVDAGAGPATSPETTGAPADLLARAAAIGALNAGPAPRDAGPPGEPGFLPTPDVVAADATPGVVDLSAGQAPGVPDPTSTVVPQDGADDAPR